MLPSPDGSVKQSGAQSAGGTDSATGGAASGTKVVVRSSYTVKPGDSLSAIAQAQGVDIATIQELNPDVDPRALRPGQKLKLKE